MRFELTIPPLDACGPSAVVAVDAPNWLVALQKALAQVGEDQIPRGKAVCEIKEDGSIVVRNPVDGRQFHIRPVEASIEINPAPPTLPRRHTPFGTMTYLEAELGPGNHAGEAPTPALFAMPQPLADKARGAPHPCMVFDRAEIERRVKEESARADKAHRRRDSAPAMVAIDPGRDVRFIQVVDVDSTTSDTLTSLRVDLAGLRAAAAQRANEQGMAGQAPQGYSWLDEPLEAALASCRSAQDAGSRTLPLLLAALPSRSAMLLVPAGEGQLIPLTTLGHTKADAHRPQGRAVAGTPLELPVLCGMSMVLDNGPGAVIPAAQLAPWLGYPPDHGLVAAVTNGAHTYGVLLLAGPLAQVRYSASDLAVANWVAGRLFNQLEYWLGAAKRTRTSP